ncbi:MAG: hypothetical protein U9Q80_10995 [Bacillota bacterium]|nr:hypothetical protein [Bacillota bacterium]
MNIKNNKGAALVMVIIMFSVLIIFGTVLVKTNFAEGMIAIRQEHETKARYAAESAASSVAILLTDTEYYDEPLHMAIRSLKLNYGDGIDNDVIRTEAPAGFPVNGHDVELEILLFKKTNGYFNVIIEATASKGNISASRTVVLSLGDGFFDSVVHAGNALNLDGMGDIDGDITYNEEIDALDLGDYNPEEYNIEFSEPMFPSDAPEFVDNGEIKIQNGGDADFEMFDKPDDFSLYELETLKIKAINVPHPVRFNIDQDKKIIIDELLEILSMDLVFSDEDEDEGVLFFFIRSGAVAKFKKSDDSLEDSDAKHLIIFGAAGSRIEINASDGFAGYIYAPSGTVTIKTGGAGFYGALVAGEFNYIYDPNADGEINQDDYNDQDGANADMTFVPFDPEFDWESYITDPASVWGTEILGRFKFEHWE